MEFRSDDGNAIDLREALKAAGQNRADAKIIFSMAGSMKSKQAIDWLLERVQEEPGKQFWAELALKKFEAITQDFARASPEQIRKLKNALKHAVACQNDRSCK